MMKYLHKYHLTHVVLLDILKVVKHHYLITLHKLLIIYLGLTKLILFIEMLVLILQYIHSLHALLAYKLLSDKLAYYKFHK